jgi:hypothetical protein
LALWHKVGTAMYFGQWVCALLVFGKLTRAAPPPAVEQA